MLHGSSAASFGFVTSIYTFSEHPTGHCNMWESNWSISWVMKGREFHLALAEVRTLPWKHLWLVSICSPFFSSRAFRASPPGVTQGKAFQLSPFCCWRDKIGLLAGEGCFFWIVLLQSSSSPNIQTCEGAREGLRIEREMRQASGNFPFHWGTGTSVILCPLGKRGQHDFPHLHTLASWSSFCLSFSIKLVKPAPQPL